MFHPAPQSARSYVWGAVAAVIVLAAMTLLYRHFSGWTVIDWDGYEALYLGEGGYLLHYGRDPAFVWLLRAARSFFSPNGYESFRLWLFVAFAAGASWLALISPIQRGAVPFSALVTAFVILAIFLLKSLVQVREGIAFLLVLAPLVGVFRSNSGGMIAAGAGALLASSIHLGSAIFLMVWLTAAVLRAASHEFLAGRAVQWISLVLGVLLGLATAFLVMRHAEALGFVLQDMGVDRSAEPIGGFLKYGYWAGLGAAIFALRIKVIQCSPGRSKFAYAYATALASVALPALYTLCAALVFTNFYIPALTSWAVRLLYSATEMALIFVLLRGGGGLVSVAMATLLAAEQARLLLITP